jgi:hypothetical protein
LPCAACWTALTAARPPNACRALTSHSMVSIALGSLKVTFFPSGEKVALLTVPR